MNRLTCSLSLLAVATTICSCATSYRAKNFFSGSGFSETKLAVDSVQIRFRGNGHTSRERTSDFAMLRAAEVCQDFGYKYFAILSGGTDTDSITYSSGGGSSYTTGQVTNYGNGNYGYSGTTYNSSPIINTINKHETEFIVKFFKSKPKGRAYDAQFISESIRKKYKM